MSLIFTYSGSITILAYATFLEIAAILLEIPHSSWVSEILHLMAI
jgi:hypothetical protein